MTSFLFDHSTGTHTNEQTVGCGIAVYQTRLEAILLFLLGNRNVSSWQMTPKKGTRFPLMLFKESACIFVPSNMSKFLVPQYV
jgi:hypothetical protein